MTLVLAAMREGEGKPSKYHEKTEENINATKLPLAARMATFIRETSYELEMMNSQLQYYNEQLKGIAKTDALTGLGNRLDFDSLLQDIEAEIDNEKDWSMLMIDLNGLKNTNDTYGHDAGDALIKGAAKVISEAYGEKGYCYRIGGDEFVVIIDADEDAMKAYREKLNNGIELYNDKEEYKLSMAVGEARLKNKDGIRNSISDWKMNADLDMYRTKDSYHRSRSQA